MGLGSGRVVNNLYDRREEMNPYMKMLVLMAIVIVPGLIAFVILRERRGE